MGDESAPRSAGGTDTDEALAAALLHGEEEAFRALYRRHTPRLKRLVLRLLGEHHAEADDALQETWVRAARQLPGFRWESIVRVERGSPADRAGLRAGDALAAIDGAAIRSPEGGRRFGAVEPGQRVTIVYERDGKRFVATLIATTRPD